MKLTIWTHHALSSRCLVPASVSSAVRPWTNHSGWRPSACCGGSARCCSRRGSPGEPRIRWLGECPGLRDAADGVHGAGWIDPRPPGRPGPGIVPAAARPVRLRDLLLRLPRTVRVDPDAVGADGELASPQPASAARCRRGDLLPRSRRQCALLRAARDRVGTALRGGEHRPGRAVDQPGPDPARAAGHRHRRTAPRRCAAPSLPAARRRRRTTGVNPRG